MPGRSARVSTGPSLASGERPHQVTFENPGAAVPDGDGGFTQTWAPCVPAALWMRIAAATVGEIERVVGGTVIATATHLFTGPFHQEVTTQTRCTFEGRTFEVGRVTDREERHIEMVLVCTEQVP
jgi:SPP1 family predicted phage head-tail adaptor